MKREQNMNERWYDKTVGQIEEKLNTDANTGLSLSVLHSRQKSDELNIIYPIKHHTFESCFKTIVSEPTTIMLFLVALIAGFLEQNTTAFVVIGLIVFNIIISVFTYKKSQQIFEDMGRLSLPTTKVMRNGKLYLIKSEQLVKGDVIYLSAGDMVPADARLIESDGLQTLEVNITGGIKPTLKDPFFLRYTHDVPPSQQANMVFASTIVVKGSGKAICCCTGKDTLVCKLQKNKKLVPKDEIKAISFAAKYSKIWSLIMICMIFVVVITELAFSVNDKSLFEIFLKALSLAAVSTGEFHLISAYVIVANGLFSAVKQNKHINSGALIKNVSKIEQLKGITCLLLNKEGAFSVRDSRIEKVYVNGSLYGDREVHFAENAGRAIRLALISTGLYGAGKLVKNNLNNENVYTPEEDAIISCAQKCKVYNINLDKEFPILEHAPKDDASKFETTLCNSDDGYLVACRGDLYTILSSCTSYSENGKIYPFDAERKANIISEAVKLSRKSYKIVAIASKITHYNNLRRMISCQSEMIFEGFYAIRERMLPGAAKNISDCQASGIKVIMLSDDIGEHNRVLAEALGIVKKQEEIVNGKELSLLKDELFRTNVPMYRLYENISIHQKRKLLEFLHEEGEVVGVLARDLNEIIMLKEADVGFVQSTTLSGKLDKAGIDMTMAKDTNSPMLIKNTKDVNKTGSEALKFISDVIISDADKRGNGGFNAILNSILASKMIYSNLIKFVKYLLTTQVARFLMVIYSVFSKDVIFEPQQIIFTGLVIDFVAMIIIAFERADNRILLKKDSSDGIQSIYKSLMFPILSGVVWSGSVVVLPFILNLIGIQSAAAHTSVVFISFIISQIAVMNECMKDGSIFKPSVKFNRAHLIMIFLVGAFLFITNYVSSIGILFGIEFPGWISIVVALIPSVLMIITYEIQKAIINSK